MQQNSYNDYEFIDNFPKSSKKDKQKKDEKLQERKLKSKQFEYFYEDDDVNFEDEF